MLSDNFLKTKVKVLLGIDDTDLYDERLDILVGGAANKLANEGIPNNDLFVEPSEEETISALVKDYLICLSYQVALDLNLDIDLQTFYVQYITRVNELRCSIKQKQN